MSIIVLKDSRIMVAYLGDHWMKWNQEQELKLMREKKTPLILLYGNLQSQENQLGLVPGEMGDLVGI